MSCEVYCLKPMKQSMSNQKFFSCPACGNKLTFKNVIKVAEGHGFNCPGCGTSIKPQKTKTWKWGYLIGLVSVVVPPKIYLTYFHGTIFVALSIGTICGVTATMGICIYVYRTTNFTIK